MTAIIEAAKRALEDRWNNNRATGAEALPLSTEEALQAILAAVTPLIRADALEEAAQELELATVADGEYLHLTPKQIADAVRSLKEQP